MKLKLEIRNSEFGNRKDLDAGCMQRHPRPSGGLPSYGFPLTRE
jgi:hypothetical protein